MQTPFLFALVLVATSALTMAAVLLLMGALRRVKAPVPPPVSGTTDPAFLFEGKILIDQNDRGAALLSSLRGGNAQSGGDWQRLTQFLSRDFPDLDNAVAALPPDRQITLAARNPASNTELIIERRNGTLRVVLVDTLAEDGAVTLDRLSYRALNDELTLLRDLIDSLPLMLWREDPQGRVTWANAAYMQRLASSSDLMTWPLPALFSPDASGAARRVSLPDPVHPTRQNWFNVQHIAENEGQLAFALPADEAHQAEHTKRDFIQTLTKTFATLPIGLAVFDRTRRLQMFNPALTDLTGLETEFLLSRPGLEGFLNRMRDKRVLPEPRDYRSWARRLLDIETTAPHGEFEETWPLPTGQTFRVSANPHPDGALAFLIEDITTETHMTLNVRAEMDTSQAVLNQIDAAIAVFSPNGHLVLTNTAFSQLWTLDGEESLSAVTLGEALENWREAGDNPGLWARIGAIVHPDNGEKSPVEGVMTLPDGEELAVDARRMSTGALMITFSQKDTATIPLRPESRPHPRAQILRASA